jgi:threonine dehydratase
VTTTPATTFADGLATRSTYEMTFAALCEGLTDFITVTDAQIADALRLLLRTTHTLVEGAGATGLAGMLALKERLAGQRVGVVVSGGNIDDETLRRVMNREI